MASKGKGAAAAPATEEKASPTDLQEIQLQMNATTDEVRDVIARLTSNG